MRTERHTVLGILAHVDAGKTTLSEGLLYKSGTIRRSGRVDHGDAFLDTFALEKQRGITIFSKQAEFTAGDRGFTLLDTPGHVDFSPEMERTLRVLDCAILVISAPEGVNGRVRTLWKLLEHYAVPTILFVNKMDQAGTDRARTLAELQDCFGSGCVAFQRELGADDAQEELAVCDEAVLEAYLDGRAVDDDAIIRMIRQRALFPCYFGAALQMEGVDDLLEGLARFIRQTGELDSTERNTAVYAAEPEADRSAHTGKHTDRPAETQKDAPQQFAARVFKISRDPQGTRLTWIRLLRGTLSVKDVVHTGITGRTEKTDETEKVDQIRIYSGNAYETVQTLEAGRIAALTGLAGTRAGQGIGAEEDEDARLLQPVCTSVVLPREGTDRTSLLVALRTLEEEEPLLQVTVNEETQDIRVGIMGEVQTEILQQQLKERFGLDVRFGDGMIAYRETIAEPVEGVGHFEPLRHYAEVHLLLEPGEPGSGLTFDADCSTDVLALNWQRLVLTHLEERSWQGVLTGSDLTDIRITLIGGRAHEKHTEGGDFRQATYRAVRQGLMEARSILLEPVYAYEFRLPSGCVGRAMTDIERMGGTINPPETDGAEAVLTGTVPAAALQGYQAILTSYTGGQGQMTCSLEGYEPCRDAAQVIEAAAYDPDADPANPSASVFCYHGAGVLIPWHEVRAHMHIDTGWRPGLVRSAGGWVDGTDAKAAAGTLRDSYSTDTAREEEQLQQAALSARELQEARRRRETETLSFRERERRRGAAEQELKEIFERTYGTVRTQSGQASATLDRTADTEPDVYDQAWRDYRRRQKEQADAGGSRRGAARRTQAVGRRYLLVDGYNIIFAWKSLRGLAEQNIDSARDALMDILSDYQGYDGRELILVFDAYRVRGGERHILRYHNISVVFTKEAETADAYIEKTAHEISRNHEVTVATSDSLEQMIIMGEGAARISAQELEQAVQRARREAQEAFAAQRSDRPRGFNRLLDHADADLSETLERMRRGE